MTDKIRLCSTCQPMFKVFLEKGGDPSFLHRFSEPAKCINCHKSVKRVRAHKLKQGEKIAKTTTKRL